MTIQTFGPNPALFVNRRAILWHFSSLMKSKVHPRIYWIETQEYEKETTETVRSLFEEVEELFYSEPQPIHPQSSVQAC